MATNPDKNEAIDPEIGPLDNVKIIEPKNKCVEPKKGKYPGFRRNIYDYFTKFSSNTGIHGFKYMGEQERSFAEKSQWCLSQQLPFASETKTRQRMYNFTNYYHKVRDDMIIKERNISAASSLTDEEIQKFSDISLICDNHLYSEGNKTTGFETIEYLISIAFKDIIILRQRFS
ncbi:hypothetical protein Zmor_023749 [Zophobas morio]|uniref:Uncharacterized protein n=1 Tax=Zophobas morio TaxID=2755281 RepID=A0AA38M7P3_9CUCU|nr:hypothetical protein Zmor_023749 [Zophobas morio]